MGEQANPVEGPRAATDWSKDHRNDLPQVVIGLGVTLQASRCGCGPSPVILPNSCCCARSKTTCGSGTSTG